MTEPLLKHSRLPRKYEPREQEPKSFLPSTSVLADVDPTELLKRYLSDESTKDIAGSYGVTRQALGQYLLKYAEDDWKQAQVLRAIARKEQSEDAIESASDPLSLARARELLRAAQWDLERTCRRIYGQDQPNVQVQVQPVLVITVAAQQGEKVVNNQ